MIGTGTQLLGRYEIGPLLGAGGMGEVYLARDLRLQRDVAVKVLPARLIFDDNAPARFVREARALAALSHPNVLAIHDYAVEKDVAFTVTELLVGETLRQRLERGRVPWPEALWILQQVADGVAAGHARGIVHRDLKPENVFLTREGGVRVLDFGLARLQELPLPPMGEIVSPGGLTTEHGAVMGTPPYMAPEQLRGDPADPRCDVFAVGVLGYEMLAGVRPFARGTPIETVTAVFHDDPAPLEVEPPVPAALARILWRTLAKDPEARPASGQEVAIALRAVATAGTEALLTTPPPRPARAGLSLIGGALVLAALALAVGYARSRPGVSSVAVLPLANASSDAQLEYLGEGIAEGVINTLAAVPRLRVMARTTTFRFKGRQGEPEKIGHELGVDAVLTGRVVAQGEGAVVEVELVEVATGAQLWGERYPLGSRGTPALEEDIASRISEHLRLRLGQGARASSRRDTMDPEAHTAYLKGLYQLNRRTPDGFRAAERLLRDAISKDPSHPRPHEALAETHALMGAYGLVPPAEAFPAAVTSARQALSLDDTLGSAHATLGLALFLHEWRFREAEAELRRAIALEPGDARGHHWYGEFLIAMGRTRDAVRELRRGEDLDPLSQVVPTDEGRAYFFGGRMEEARGQCARVLVLDRGFVPAIECLALVATEEGRFPEALARLDEVARLATEDKALSSRAIALARAGRTADARACLARLGAGNGYVPPYALAMVHAALGEPDAAFARLEEAMAERSVWMPYLHVDPRARALRTDPRYDALVRRIGTAD